MKFQVDTEVLKKCILVKHMDEWSSERKSDKSCYSLENRESFVRTRYHVDGLRLCLWTVTTSGPIIRYQDDIWVWRATVEWYWQGNTEELGENSVPVPLYPT
jgi:hypothetical protein